MDMNMLHLLEESASEELFDTYSSCLESNTVLQDFLVEHYELLRRRLTHHLGCRDFASECLHDTWLRLVNMKGIGAVLNPEAYVYRMACNAAMDRLRSNRTWQYQSDATLELDDLVDLSPGPDMIVENRSNLAAMDRAMQGLSARNRNVLIALRVEEMTRQEVAAYYDLSLRTVDTVLRRSLDYCADILKSPRNIPQKFSANQNKCYPVTNGA